MRLQLKVRHGDHVSDEVRAYVEEKVAKLGRRLREESTLADIELSREHNPAISADHVAEVIVYTKGSNLQAREAAATYEVAVDRVVEKLERQLERYKGKRNRHEVGKRAVTHGALPEAETVPVEAIEAQLRAEVDEPAA
jgi:putative sigma-54 modulation protein